MARLTTAAVLAATLAAFAVLPAHANEVFASDTKTIVTAMQASGFPAELQTNDEGSPFISSSVDGINFAVNFYGCGGPDGCQWIEFSASFVTETPVSQAAINDWNASNLFGTSFLGDGDDIFLTYVVTTTGGLTRANFADVLTQWQIAIGEFLRHIKF